MMDAGCGMRGARNHLQDGFCRDGQVPPLCMYFQKVFKSLLINYLIFIFVILIINT